MNSNIKTRIWQILGALFNKKSIFLITSQYFGELIYMDNIDSS